MPWYEGSHSEEIAAPRERCYEILTDYERVPEWQGPVSRCEVVERDGEGEPAVVEYTISTPVRDISYRLRHSHDPPDRVSGELVEGQIKGFEGEWRFEEAGPETTRVEFAVRIDPGRWVPGKIARMLHDAVMKRAVSDLKAKAESRSG